MICEKRITENDISKIFPDQGFYISLNRLQKHIKRFVKKYNEMLKTKQKYNVGLYIYMNKLRLTIKEECYNVEEMLFYYAFDYAKEYYDLLDVFKYYYSKWKNQTYYVYLNVVFEVPVHIAKTLYFYFVNKHCAIGGAFL